TPAVTVTSVAPTVASGGIVTFTTSPVALAAVTLFTVIFGSANVTVVSPDHSVASPLTTTSSVRPRKPEVGVTALTVGGTMPGSPLSPFVPSVPSIPAGPAG